MAELHFKAFVSHSFAEADRALNDYFVELIRAFDLDPIVYDYQEIGRVAEKIKQQLAKSDCLIAVATKRAKLEGSDSWSCADWIQHELALANAYNLPIAVFLEEGVRVDGLLAMEERRQAFRRESLADQTGKIAKFLFKLRTHLDESHNTNTVRAPRMLRHYIRSREEVVSAEQTIERTEILMESLTESLEATHHEIELEETTPGLSVKPEEFDFRCLEMPSGTSVTPEIVLNTDFRFFWKIIFSPPLRPGDRVKYAFKEVRRNHRPMTLSDLNERIKNGTYEYKTPIVEACEWTILYPTYELRHDFEFPPGYEIDAPHPCVMVGDARSRADDEIRRIRDGGMFSAERVFDKWVLRLSVPKPLLNHTYYTYFSPKQ